MEKNQDVVEWEDVAFSEYCADQFAPVDECFLRMIRQDEWKLIYYPAINKRRLYNLKADPLEMNDLADKPKYAKPLARLEKSLANLNDRFNDPLDVDNIQQSWKKYLSKISTKKKK